MTEKLEQLAGNRDPGANEATMEDNAPHANDRWPAGWTRPSAIGAPRSAAPAGEVPGEDRGGTASESLAANTGAHPSQPKVMARRICRVAVLGATPIRNASRPMKSPRLKTSSI